MLSMRLRIADRESLQQWWGDVCGLEGFAFLKILIDLFSGEQLLLRADWAAVGAISIFTRSKKVKGGC
jgi:hypothetical protein